jgi:hypothetical protein
MPGMRVSRSFTRSCNMASIGDNGNDVPCNVAIGGDNGNGVPCNDVAAGNAAEYVDGGDDGMFSLTTVLKRLCNEVAVLRRC